MSLALSEHILFSCLYIARILSNFVSKKMSIRRNYRSMPPCLIDRGQYKTWNWILHRTKVVCYFHHNFIQKIEKSMAFNDLAQRNTNYVHIKFKVNMWHQSKKSELQVVYLCTLDNNITQNEIHVCTKTWICALKLIYRL